MAIRDDEYNDVMALVNDATKLSCVGEREGDAMVSGLVVEGRRSVKRRGKKSDL